MRPATLGVTPGVDTLVRGAATREKVPRVPVFPLFEGQLLTLPQPLPTVLVGAAANYSGQSWVVPAPAQNGKIDSRCHLTEGKHGRVIHQRGSPGYRRPQK